MNKTGIVIILLCFLAAAAVVLWERRKARKTMEEIERMLDAAMTGSFSETNFDESQLSALETKFAHYLSAAEASSQNIAQEKDKIKTLIADISHQTKTPIANLLLYSELLMEETLPASAKANVEALYKQSEKLRFLIDSLVKLSRLENGIISLTPQQAALFGRDRHPAECNCQKAQRLEREAAEQRRKHLDTVEDLKRGGFTNPTMQEWTFANDNGKCPQMEIAHFYVEHWEIMREENIGYLLWGKVGTGKSYFAGCIANALMEQEVAVRMTNFSAILNDLTASFEGRNEYIERLCRFPLLIIDDFGMERGTEYGLEQVYNVIDSRYRSGKPLIATTNLTLEELQHPQDTPHARIYDRLTSMCAPVRFTGSNFRKETAQEKLERLKQLMKQRKESL